MEENTTGFASLKPGKGSGAGLLSRVIVSPMLVSLTVLIPAIRYPTSPAESVLSGSRFRPNLPTSSTLYVALLDINLMVSLAESFPEKTLQLTIVPLKES